MEVSNNLIISNLIFSKLKEVFGKKITTLFLLFAVIFLIAVTLLSDQNSALQLQGEVLGIQEEYSKPNSAFLPEGFIFQDSTSPTPINLFKTSPTIKPTKPQTQKTSLSTPTVKPTSLDIDIDSSSTIEGRDRDREIIFKYLYDSIEEYLFYYDKLPEIYIDKSATLLSDEPSELIYFYNGDENKTNAISINLGTESYVFSRFNKCEDVQFDENLFAFTYSLEDKKIFLCLESGKAIEYEF